MKRCLMLAALTLLLLPLKSGAQAAAGSNAWANPQQMALKNITPAHIPERYHTLQTENFACQDLSPPQIGGGNSAGCFIVTAFGQEDVESNRAIFAGTSGVALPLTPFIGGQVLIGWPGSDTVLALTSLPSGGVQIGMYRFFTAALTDQTNIIGQVVGKRVNRAPDVILSDATNRTLVFNPNSLAFSDRGGWLVGETLNAGAVRINLATLSTLIFAPSLSDSQLAISDDGHYAAVANRATVSFRVFDLTNCSAGSCPSYNYWSFLSGQLPSGFAPAHLRFLNNGLLGFHANSGPLEANYLLAPTDHIDAALSYLGLGDSFAAGEGAGQYRPGTDTVANKCHLSAVSYPFLARAALYTSVAANSVACSGAVIDDIEPSKTSSANTGPDDTYNNLLTSFMPGSLAQSAFVSQYQPALITTQIGGNDIGFHDIIIECVMLHARRSNSCYNSYEDRLELADLIDRTLPKLTRLYKQLKAHSPQSTLYVVGYPEIVTPGNCADNVRLDASEIQLAGYLIHHLNAAVAEATKQSGATYIDVSQAFVGHRLCEAASATLAVNGLTAGNDTGLVLPRGLGGGNLNFVSNGSYHPNNSGQQLLAALIIARLRGAPIPASSNAYTPAASDSTGLLSAPKTNRPLTALMFRHVTSGNIAPGQALVIGFEGQGIGLRPNTDYTVRLDGSAGAMIGTVHTNNSGQVNTTVPVPASLSDEQVHTVDIIDPNQAGELADVRQVITLSTPPVAVVLPTGNIPAVAETNTANASVSVSSLSPKVPPGQSGSVLGAATSSSLNQDWPPLRVVVWRPYAYLLTVLWTTYAVTQLCRSRVVVQ
ncbi:MAG: hypothetical protein JWO41_125 [Candidatus Saccharibacteria bacterium]|nr:hypothetical protein [Candidatus Saccharibacteria bacterium]